MGNERLLTEEETSKYKSYDGTHIVWEKQLLEAQDAKTLKEMGEWLESVHHYVDCLDTRISRGFLITEKDIETLKQGKMPEKK